MMFDHLHIIRIKTSESKHHFGKKLKMDNSKQQQKQIILNADQPPFSELLEFFDLEDVNTEQTYGLIIMM